MYNEFLTCFTPCVFQDLARSISVMIETLLAAGTGLDPLVVLGLLAASFVASFITVALGIGGGILSWSICLRQ